MKRTVVTADGTFPCNTAPIQGAYEEAAEQAAAIGYEGIQLTIMDPRQVCPEEIRSAALRRGLRISAIATGRIYSVLEHGLGDGDEASRLEAVRLMKAHVDLAEQLRIGGEAPYVIVGAVRGRYADAESPEQYYQQFHSSMKELIAYAADRRITVIMEAIELSESEAYRDITETAEYIRSFGTPYFGLQIDTMHMRREHQSLDQVRAAADVLLQADISGDSRSCPADDDYDYPALIEALKAMDYRGWLTFEYNCEKDSAERGFRYISELMRR